MNAENEEFEEQPPLTDFHGNKRELLKRGLERGKLYWSEVRDVLPQNLVSEAEMEVFIFTCKNLGIDLIDD